KIPTIYSDRGQRGRIKPAKKSGRKSNSAKHSKNVGSRFIATTAAAGSMASNCGQSTTATTGAMNSDNLDWGIIRYAPSSGSFPEDDAAGFDGWYSDRADALAVAEDWAKRFPYWIVALVSTNKVWFGTGDFSTLRDKPLTERECKLLTMKSTM